MSKNIEQVFIANPITTNTDTDLMYFGQSPYSSGADDAAMTYGNFASQFLRFTWNNVAGTTQSVTVNNGYVSNNSGQTTFTLPATAAFGSIIAVEGVGAGGWIIQANTGQTIEGGSDSSSSAGTVTSQSGTDNIYLLCIVANTTWKVTSSYSQGLTYF